MAEFQSQMTEKTFLEDYEAYADALFRHLYFRVFDRECARDLLQDVFTKTWEYITKGKTIENLRAFLYQVANNIVIDYARKKKTISLEALNEESGFDPPNNDHQRIHTESELSQILSTLCGLDDEDHQLIILRYIDDLGPKEIAEQLSVSENVVSVRLNRAIKKARVILKIESL